jgi:hypothetical protein
MTGETGRITSGKKKVKAGSRPGSGAAFLFKGKSDETMGFRGGDRPYPWIRGDGIDGHAFQADRGFKGWRRDLDGGQLLIEAVLFKRQPGFDRERNGSLGFETEDPDVFDPE